MKRILTIWATLGAAYVVFETLFRGYSHPSMFVVGGLCGVLVGAINQNPRFYRAPVIVQSVIGAVIVLAVEFISGCVLNLWLPPYIKTRSRSVVVRRVGSLFVSARKVGCCRTLRPDNRAALVSLSDYDYILTLV